MSNDSLEFKIKSIDEQILELRRQKDQLQQEANALTSGDDFIDIAALLDDANIAIQNILISHGFSEDELFEIQLNNHTKLVRATAFVQFKLVTKDKKIIYRHNNYACYLDKWLESITDRALLIAKVIKEFDAVVEEQHTCLDEFMLIVKDYNNLIVRLALSESDLHRLDAEMSYDLEQSPIFETNQSIPIGDDFVVDIYGEDSAYLTYRNTNMSIKQVFAAISKMLDRVRKLDID